MMRPLQNQRGDAFLLSILALVISMIAFLSLQTIGHTLEKKIAVSRARAQMSLLESQIRQHFRQPSAFTGCQSAAGVTACQINTGAFNAWSRVPGRGGLCGAVTAGSACEFRAEIMSFDTGSRKIQVRLQLSGSLQMNASDFTIDVPDEILQSSSFTCADLDPARPVMTGFDTTSGRVICRGLTNCPAGQHMVAITASSSEPQCAPLPQGQVSCGAGQMLSRFEWRGGGTVNHACQSRLDPFSYFGGP